MLMTIGYGSSEQGGSIAGEDLFIQRSLQGSTMPEINCTASEMTSMHLAADTIIPRRKEIILPA
jgi:hypothetical protein